MLTQKIFYRRYGIRRLSELLTSEKFPIHEYPNNTILHYNNIHDDSDVDLDHTLPWFTNSKRKIIVDFVNELKLIKGKARRKNINIKSLVNKWLIKHKLFKYVPEGYKTHNDIKELIAVNYNYLDMLYKYPDTPMSGYYKWYNKYATMLNYVNEAGHNSNRNQFITINIPTDIPSLSLLKLFSDKENIGMLKIFHDNDMLVILELWKWLHDDLRERSLFSILDDDILPNINLVFKNEQGLNSLLNLGYLDSFIKGHDNKTEFDEVTQAKDVTVGKYFIKYLLDVQAIDNVNEETDDEFLDKDRSGSNDEKILEATNKEIGNIKYADKSVEESLKLLEKTNKERLLSATGHVVELKVNEDIKKVVLKSPNAEERLIDRAKEKLETGEIKLADFKSIEKAVKEYNTSKNPYGGNESVREFSIITEDDIKLDEDKVSIVSSELVKDKSMTKSTLRSYDDKYINNVLKKDIVNVVRDIQKAGVVVKEHNIKVYKTAVNQYEEHTLKLKPIDGSVSTVKVRLPIVDENGFMTVNGSTYVMRKQRVDLPIRKIKPNIVSLFSYYGKSFVIRSSKKADNNVAWLVKQINMIGLETNNLITDLSPADVYDNNFKAPFIYNALAENYRSFRVGNKYLLFDHKERLELTDNKVIDNLESKGYRLCGITDSKELILVDYKDVFFIYKNGKFNEIGDIYKLTEIDNTKSPIDITELKVFKKTIPLGIVLGYYVGYENLLKLLDVKYRTTENSRERINSNEFKISFSDVTYIFNKKDVKSSLILAGFTKYKNIIKTFKVSDFNTRDIYLNLLSSKGLTAIYIRELDSLRDLFVDNITRSILESLNEPTTYLGLLIRANEMLLDYNHPDSQDTAYMRIRGYERLAGFMYASLSYGIRSFRSRNISGKAKIDIGDFEVFNDIMNDNSIKIIEDTNPVQNLKEKEVITYSGTGGRSAETLNKESRAYHIHDIGIVSEGTVDSSSVGVNAYLSPDANLLNVRGITTNDKEITSSKLLSTSALLAPGAIHDDAKRVNFINIQNSHTIATVGYRQPQLRTGYEYIIPKRTSSKFSYAAKQDGKVISINNDGLIIEYKDGSREGVELGTVYGKAEGAVYPHPIVSNVKENQIFKKDDILAYNSNFFEQDILDPSSIIYKTNFYVKTALYESDQTFEDSSSISKDIASKLKTTITKTKEIVVSFDQNIIEAVNVGDVVKVNQPYMIIEDPITSSIGNFSEDSLKALSKLSSQTPKSNYDGKVVKIEVLYNGDKENMSDGLRRLADKSDRILSKKLKSTGKDPMTGKIDSDFRVNGSPLLDNTAVIIIYLDVEDVAGVGDKGVFANQLKSVFGEVMDYDMITETGTKVDAVFGFRSIAARIVLSPMIIGTTITLLKVIAKKSIEIYEGES